MTASAPTTRQTLFKANHPRWGVVVPAFLLGALALMIVTSPRHFRYDEVYHLRATRLIGRLGWKEGLNSPQNTSSAGPMYSAIHLLASPLTHLRPPAVRYINWFFLVVVVAVTAAQLRRCKAASPLFAAGLLLSVPFLWPSAGLALTELPALAVS